MYSTVLFDLDGTLTDPGLGITNSAMYALKKYGIEVKERNSLYKFIGPPLHESFEIYYGFTFDEAMKAVAYYREYYSEKGIFENRVYDGIEAMLKELKSAEKRLILATSKPTVFAEKILEHFGLSQYFDYVAGSNLDGTRTAKSEVIAHAIEECGLKDIESIVMVGDRKHDILGAGAWQMDSIGVLYGYGDYEELKSAGATFIADKPEDISQYILKKLKHN